MDRGSAHEEAFGLVFRISSFGGMIFDTRLRVSGFGFRVSAQGFRFRVSVFGFRVSGVGLGFRASGFGCSGFGLRVSGFGFRTGGVYTSSHSGARCHCDPSAKGFGLTSR